MTIDRLTQLHEAGFDASYYNEDSESYRVRCSQCEAVVINGLPCHEHGCPNQNHTDESETEDSE